MSSLQDPSIFAATIVERLSVGIVTVNAKLEVLQWNGFMVANTGCQAEWMLGQINEKVAAAEREMSAVMR